MEKFCKIKQFRIFCFKEIIMVVTITFHKATLGRAASYCSAAVSYNSMSTLCCLLMVRHDIRHKIAIKL